jgi:MFS family permease
MEGKTMEQRADDRTGLRRETGGNAPLRRNRDFQLLLIGSTVAGLGSTIGNLAVPLLVLWETGSPSKAGLVGSLQAVALAVAILPAGAVADAVERRRLMIGSQLAGVLVAAVLAGAVLAGAADLSLILAATAAGAVISSLYAPAAVGLVQAVVPAEQFGAASARLQARNAALQIAGPLTGGVIFSVSPAMPFIARAGALLVATASLLAVRTRSAPVTVAGRAAMSLRELTAGFRFVWQQRYLRIILIVYGAGMGAAFSAVMLVALTATVRADPTGRSSGTMVALTAAGSLIGAMIAPRLGIVDRAPRILTLTCWVSAAIVPLLALVAARPLAIGLLLGAVLLAAAIGTVALETEMLRLTPPGLIGRAEAGQVFLSTVAVPLGPLGGGLLVELFGSDTAFIALGGALVALAATLTIALRRPVR